MGHNFVCSFVRMYVPPLSLFVCVYVPPVNFVCLFLFLNVGYHGYVSILSENLSKMFLKSSIFFSQKFKAPDLKASAGRTEGPKASRQA